MNKFVKLHTLMSLYTGVERKMACHGYTLHINDNGNVVKAMDSNGKNLFRAELRFTDRWDSSTIVFEDLFLFERTVHNGVPKISMSFQGVECSTMSMQNFTMLHGFTDEQEVNLLSEEGRFQASVISDLDFDMYHELLLQYNEAALVIPKHDKMIVSFNDTPFASKILDDIIISLESLHREKA